MLAWPAIGNSATCRISITQLTCLAIPTFCWHFSRKFYVFIKENSHVVQISHTTYLPYLVYAVFGWPYFEILISLFNWNYQAHFIGKKLPYGTFTLEKINIWKRELIYVHHFSLVCLGRWEGTVKYVLVPLKIQ